MKKSIFLFFAAILCATNAWAWCGNSFITVNGLWCTGSNSYVHDGGKFHGKDLGTLTTLELGGEFQVWPSSTTAGTLCYKIDDGTENSISLPKTGTEGNNSKHSGSGAVDLSGLAGGSHSIAVWFKHGSDTDNNSGSNFVATFTIAAATPDPEPEPEPIADVTVHFINSVEWAAVACHHWVDGGSGTSWPGDVLSKTDEIAGYDVYTATFTGAHTSCIFNNNNKGNQTGDLTVEDGKYYEVNTNTWYADKAAAEAALATPIPDETVYLINTGNWSKAMIHTWNGVGGTAWPGVEMTLTGETIEGYAVYSYTAKQGGQANLLFQESENVNKTGDLTWEAGKYYAPSKNEWYADAAAAEAALATPDVITYVLMGVGRDWTTGIALTKNETAEYEEYVLLGQEIAEGDAVKVVTLTNGVATAWCGNVDEFSVAHTSDDNGNIVLAPGKYDFYFKVNDPATADDDIIYIGGEAYPTTATVTVADPIGSMSTYTGVEYDESAETWSKVYNIGEEVTISVNTVGEGWVFAYWTVGEEKIFTEEYTFTVAEDVTVTATYAMAMDVTFDNLVLDAETGIVTAGPDALYGIELTLGIDMVNDHPKGFGLVEGSSISLGGNELELVTGYFTAIDVNAPSAEAVVMAVYEEMLMAFVCSMTAAPAPAYNVVVENATLTDNLEESGFFFMDGTWSDGETIYPVKAEIPGFDATVASATYRVTVTVGGQGDEPWLGFGEGEATVTVNESVVTLTVSVQNEGFKADVTISGTLPKPQVPTALGNIDSSVAPVKMINNGQLVIINNGVQYNAQGAVVK